MCCGTFRSTLQEFTRSGGAAPNLLDLRRTERQPRGAYRTSHDGWLCEFSRALLCAPLLLCVIFTACSTAGSGATSPPVPPAPPPLAATVSVTPNSAQPFQGGNVQFDAVVKNASNSAVTWQVNLTTGGNPMVGTIDPTGLYTAPASVPSPPTVIVTAVLQSDSTKAGSSSVTIQGLSSV